METLVYIDSEEFFFNKLSESTNGNTIGFNFEIVEYYEENKVFKGLIKDWLVQFQERYFWITDIKMKYRCKDLNGCFRVKGLNSVLATGFCSGKIFAHIKIEIINKEMD